MSWVPAETCDVLDAFDVPLDRLDLRRADVALVREVRGADHEERAAARRIHVHLDGRVELLERPSPVPGPSRVLGGVDEEDDLCRTLAEASRQGEAGPLELDRRAGVVQREPEAEVVDRSQLDVGQ